MERANKNNVASLELNTKYTKQVKKKAVLSSTAINYNPMNISKNELFLGILPKNLFVEDSHYKFASAFFAKEN